MARPLQEWCGWFADAEGAIRPVYDAAGNCVGIVEISLEEFYRIMDREYAQNVALNNRSFL